MIDAGISNTNRWGVFSIRTPEIGIGLVGKKYQRIVVTKVLGSGKRYFGIGFQENLDGSPDAFPGILRIGYIKKRILIIMTMKL